MADQQPLIASPLPKLQLFIVILIQVAEPVTSTVIYPFVNDLIRGLGTTHGDEKLTGYYIGLVESIFYASEALTVIQWGRLSDSIGRRPVLLAGMLGLAGSMVSFGLSTKYWMLLASRCSQGAFNGNIGVTKSVISEITDPTNAPQAFSLLPVAWSIGSTLGPFIGGVFAEPAEQWPELFGSSKLFKNYPYLLSCVVSAAVPISAFLLGFLGLKETLPVAVAQTQQTAKAQVSGCPPAKRSPRDYGATSDTEMYTSGPAEPPPRVPFRGVLTPRVLITVTNFAALAFLDQSLLVLLPLIYSTPLPLGGLGLPPAAIGRILGAWGVVNGVVQVTCFARVRRALGHRACYTLGLASLGACFALFPALAHLAAWDGGRAGGWVRLGVALQLGAYMFAYMSYACMFMYIAAAAPSRGALGTTNGLAQLVASSARALAPSAASSLFSLSLELQSDGQEWGGYLVYFVLCAVCAVALRWSLRLPAVLEGPE